MSLWRRVYTERRRVAAPLIVVLVTNLAVVALVVLPLRQSVISYETEAVDATIRLRDARELDKAARGAQASRERADEELRRFYADILPTSFSDARTLVVFWLQRLARESQVAFRYGSFDYQPVRESRLMRVTGKVVLEGEYQNIRRFLYHAETAQEFVVIETVELLQPGAVGSSGALEVSLHLATYYVPAAGGQ